MNKLYFVRTEDSEGRQYTQWCISTADVYTFFKNTIPGEYTAEDAENISDFFEKDTPGDHIDCFNYLIISVRYKPELA